MIIILHSLSSDFYGQGLGLREAESWPRDTQPWANQSQLGPWLLFSLS